MIMWRPRHPLVVVTAPGPGSGKMATCLSQLYHDYKRGIACGLRQVRDLPHLEPAPQASGESGLRGGHRGSERREHDRPLPSGGLRQDHRQLQPGCGDLPGAERHLREDPGHVPLQVPHGHGREHGGQLHLWTTRCAAPPAAWRSCGATTPPAWSGCGARPGTSRCGSWSW